MTTLSFPANPIVGQTYLSDTGTTWTYDGVKWIVGQVAPAPVITPPPPPPIPPPTPVPTTVYDPLLNLSFPANPTLGQLYTTPTGTVYRWDGAKWTVYSSATITSPSTVTTTQYVLPKATSTTLGGVIIGSGIDNADGTISVNLGGIASSIENTVIAAVEAVVQVPATANTLGEVKVGSNINVATDGTISVPIATNTTLGVVKAGANVIIDGAGTINIPTGAGINTLESISNVNPSSLTDGSLLVYNTAASRWDVTANLTQENWDSGQY
jgi:hypothetical protein